MDFLQLVHQSLQWTRCFILWLSYEGKGVYLRPQSCKNINHAVII